MVYSNVGQSLQEKDLSCLLYKNTFAMWEKLKDKANRPRQRFCNSAYLNTYLKQTMAAPQKGDLSASERAILELISAGEYYLSCIQFLGFWITMFSAVTALVFFF